jgi:hypothetical protein
MAASLATCLSFDVLGRMDFFDFVGVAFICLRVFDLAPNARAAEQRAALDTPGSCRTRLAEIGSPQGSKEKRVSKRAIGADR